MNRRAEPWDRKLMRWIDWNREIIMAFVFGILIGFFIGAFTVMTQHHRFIIALLEQSK